LIRIKALVKGESDLPFTKLFEFKNEDEAIFLNVVEMIKDKLSRNLKLNVHEALLVYCVYLVSETRLHKSESEIKDNSSKILTRNNVLIGVPETLREITFNSAVDNLPKRTIQFVEPIPTKNYILIDSGVSGTTNREKL
jgi:urease subunit gamma